LYLFFYTITKKKEVKSLHQLQDTVQLGIHSLPYAVVRERKMLEKHIYPDMYKNYYWSDDFSAIYYIAQAKAGFIAVTDCFEGEELLLPEIQFAYTLLDFENLHISRKVQKLLKQKRVALETVPCLEEVVYAIEKTHKHNWLTPKYLKILKETEGIDENFQVLAFGIREGEKLVAGELGYKIGSTYTSLSGFTERNKRYNHYGNAQLVLLAQYLQKEGFAFWNLGQPYMAYKFALGAKAYTRPLFLQRWFDAVNTPL